MKIISDLPECKRNNCQIPEETSFCQLPLPELKNFESIRVPKGYPKGSTLFMEGQPTKGVYLLCRGRVKLSTCSSTGKVMILSIAESGAILGLSAALNGCDYETTAETLEFCQVNFVEASDLLRFLKTNPEACLRAAKQLSRNYQATYDQVCSLGLSDSAADKLAKLFLGWTGNGSGGDGSVRIRNHFTHEELAEMIGASRETVTRALKHFRECELITLKGSDLVIHDRGRLKASIRNYDCRRSQAQT